MMATVRLGLDGSCNRPPLQRGYSGLAVRVPPTVQPAEWIGRVKGGTSHDWNQLDRWRLDWQAGYGVVSFGQKDLAWVIQYVQNQEEHHLKGTVFERLESIIEVDA